MAGLGLRELGATGLRVTSIGYGCSPLGNLYGTVKEEEAIASVHEAARLGVNYFDVSPYGHPLPSNFSSVWLQFATFCYIGGFDFELGPLLSLDAFALS